jgi:hypothetical protein
MLYLARKEYPDRLMEEEDLDAVADLWRAWHDKRCWGARFARNAYQFLEIRVWGFARDRSAALVSLLRKSLDSSGLPETTVELLDPDTIRIASPPVPVAELLLGGLWLGLFRGEEFAGLPLMLRLSINEYRGEPEGRPADSAGLVVVGKLHENCLQLKAIWPNSLEVERLDPLFRMAVWPEEKHFLWALDEFQATGRAPPVKSELFVSRRQEQFAYWFIRLLFDLPGQAKLPAFLARTGFFVCLVFLAGLLFFQTEMFVTPTLVLLGVLGLAGFGFNVWWKARMIVAYHSRMKAALRKVYSRSITLPAVDLAQLGVADNPVIVKYSRELEAFGGRHLIDVRIDPPTSNLSYIRVFQFAEDHTQVLLNVMLATANLHFFPANSFLLVSTHFADGSKLTSINSKASGFQRSRRTNMISRRFPGIDNPGELLVRHREVLNGLLNEGRRLAPLLSTEGFVRAWIKEHEENGELAKEQGYYTWGAAFRQSFGIVRREYVQDS